MQNASDVSAAELRRELSPVSERFGAFELGDALVVYDESATDAWVCSDVAYDRESMR